MSSLGTLLQVDHRTWSTIRHQELGGRIMTVFFAYIVLAWNRFGLLTFTSPRVPLRVLLVGIYSWLGLALVIWVASGWGDRGRTRFRDATVAAAIVQIPVLVVAFFTAIVAGFARIVGPGLVLAIVVSVVWIPALLTRAFREVAGLSWTNTAMAVVGVHLLWLAVPARWLYGQVGHLL